MANRWLGAPPLSTRAGTSTAIGGTARWSMRAGNARPAGKEVTEHENTKHYIMVDIFAGMYMGCYNDSPRLLTHEHDLDQTATPEK